MFILNKYNITTDDATQVVTVVSNVNPNVVTGVSGDSVANDQVITITAKATYVDQVISKLINLTINAPLSNSVNSYITIDLTKLGISGTRPVLAASLLGVYNPSSIEQTASGATPSFIGMWDKTAANVTSLSIVNSKLILRIPTAEAPLFSNKSAMIQLFYSTNNGE
jgi:hypothetical protein